MSRPALSNAIRRLDPDAPSAMDRRAFLKAALGVGAGLMLSSSAWAARPTGGRLLVVGGGLGGLSAAFEARSAGLDVRVFEARDRLGGRVLSIAADGQVHEAGAELIGSNHPRWVTYADRFGLGLRPLGDEPGDSVIVHDGRALSKKEIGRLWRGVSPVLRRLTRAAKGVPGDTPWSAPAAELLDTVDLATWMRSNADDPLVRDFLTRLFAADAAVPAGEQSLLGMLATITGGGGKRYWTESEAFRCEGGNQRLPLALGDALGPELVRTGAPVSAIRWTPGAAAVSLADGTLVEGDAVICALPPTLWGDIRFDPPLPAELRPTMGRAVKRLTRLKRPIWHATGRSPDAFSDGVVAMTWDGTDGQPGASRWLVSFSGAESADAGLAMDDAARASAYATEHERLFPGLSAEVVEQRYYDWPNDPRTRGGYSAPGVGEVTTVRRALHEGLFPLIFAGEHCSTAFPGYMEGALESGGRAAGAAVARLG